MLLSATYQGAAFNSEKGHGGISIILDWTLEYLTEHMYLITSRHLYGHWKHFDWLQFNDFIGINGWY